MREPVPDAEPPPDGAAPAASVPDALCDTSVLLFALWTLAANVTAFFGGNLYALLVGFAAAVAAVFALRRPLAAWWRIPSPGAVPRTVPSSGPTPRERIAGLLAALGVVLVYVATRNVALLWLGTTMVLIVLATREVRGQALWPAARATRPQVRVLWGLCVLCALLVLLAHRSDEDDAFYVNLAVAAADDPALPLLARDTLHRMPGLPLPNPVYRVHSIELLAGALAFLTPLSALEAAHVVIPPAAAFLLPLAHARLLRRLTPKRWIWAVVCVVAFLVLGGETHRSHANHAFVRMHQGKAVLLSVVVPLIAAYGIEFALAPSRARWTRLVLVQVAAVGLTSTSLWLAPLIAGLSLVAAVPPRLGALRILALGVAASFHPIGLGLSLRADMMGFRTPTVTAGRWDWTLVPLSLLAGAGLLAAAHRWAAARRAALIAGLTAGLFVAAVGVAAPESLPLRLTGVLGESPRLFMMSFVWTTGGSRFACMAFLAFLAVWAVAGPALVRRFAVVFGLAFVLFWNPYTADWVGAAVTSRAAYERVFWILPLPALFALAVTEPVGLVAPGRLRTGVVIGCVAAAGVALLWAPLDHTLSGANRVRLALPGPKVPPEELEVARAIVAHASPEVFVLAPLTVSPWLSTLHGYPRALVIRRMYVRGLRRRYPAAEVERREALADLVSGHLSPPDAAELLGRAVEEYPLGVVCLARAAATQGLRDALRGGGLEQILVTEAYEVWARQ